MKNYQLIFLLFFLAMPFATQAQEVQWAEKIVARPGNFVLKAWLLPKNEATAGERP